MSGKSITRVFLIKNLEDLNNKSLIEQIKLDLKSGIDVRFIVYQNIIDINCSEDFGIWDNEYVCTIVRDSQGVPLKGIIDARVKNLLTAQNWRDRIMRLSTKINNLKDIEDYKKK